MAYRKRWLVHHHVHHFTVDSIAEGAGRETGKKSPEDLDLPEIAPTARAQDAYRPQAKHTP